MSASSTEKFKGWTIPGPRVPGPALLESGELRVEEGESLDALGGFFRIFQLSKGHRFSTDDVVVAWYGASAGGRAETVLDLGSGIGSVAQIAAWRLPFARFVTVEAQEVSFGLAQKSLRFNGLTERFDQRKGDFRDPEVFRGPEEQFDLVLGSPPYFPLDAGILGDHPQKIACRFETRGTIWDYTKVARERMNPGAMYAVVFPIQPAEQEERVRAAARDHRMVIVRERPVCFREGEPPMLGLFLMMREEDLPVERLSGFPVKEPELVIRTKEGKVGAEYMAVKLSIGFPP